MTLYSLKPRFQALLRPAVARLAQMGVTANQVTLLAAALSCLAGGFIVLSGQRKAFLILPPLLFLRMALNAVDGMLAREFGQKSHLGAYLNELSDVVADAALAAPFMLVMPFSPVMVMFVILLAAISEYAGAMGPLVGASRRYDGPLGKSDRAFVFGALGLWVGCTSALPGAAYWIMPVLGLLLIVTTINRIGHGTAEADRLEPPL